MRRFFGICLILICSILLQVNTANAQEEKKGQLWYCLEEVVKTDHWHEYKDLSKEIIKICKEVDFPYHFSTWATGELSYALWFPIDSHADIDKMEKAWGEIMDKFGEEKRDAFRKTLDYRKTFTARVVNELSFIPDTIRFKWEDVKYCRWSEYYLKTGTMDNVKKVIKDVNRMLKEKGVDDPWYVAIGGIGVEGPMIAGFSYGIDAGDFWTEMKKRNKIIGDDFKPLLDAFYVNVREVVRKEYWYAKDLSYEKEETPKE